MMVINEMVVVANPVKVEEAEPEEIVVVFFDETSWGR